MKNISKEVLGAIIISTILCGCKNNRESLADILDNNKDTTYVDDYFMEDGFTRNNVYELEENINIYFAVAFKRLCLGTTRVGEKKEKQTNYSHA